MISIWNVAVEEESVSTSSNVVVEEKNMRAIPTAVTEEEKMILISNVIAEDVDNEKHIHFVKTRITDHFHQIVFTTISAL